MLEDVDNLPDLLVFEKPPHELCARVFPRFVSFASWQQHLRLDTHEPRGHLEVVSCFIELQRLDTKKKLFSDSRDRYVLNVDLLVADQSEQQIERTGKLRQLDDEYFSIAKRSSRQLIHGFGSMNPATLR